MSVRVTFKEEGELEYEFIHVQSETGSNLTRDKATIIEGVRADGSIYIPAGKKSQRIVIKGILVGEDYIALTTLMNTMKTKITTKLATLTLKHNETEDWSYTVRRIGEVSFPVSLRTDSQEYSAEFLVLSYS